MYWLNGRSRQLPRLIRDTGEGSKSRERDFRLKSRSHPMTLTLGLFWCVVALTSMAVSAQDSTDAPTAISPAVTAFPSLSAAPSPVPSLEGPTGSPSTIPSDLPSGMPSLAPTPEATFETPIEATSGFRQEFAVENGRLFTASEQTLFEGLYASYTEVFAPTDITGGEFRVRTECDFLVQQFVEPTPSPAGRSLSFSARHKYHMRARRLQASTFIRVDYNMAYSSNYTNVTTFPLLFQSYVNTELANVARQMQILGLNVSEAFLASRVIVRPDPTLSPTGTPRPTTLAPSVSRSPSEIPSDMPSLAPSFTPPTARPSPPPTDAPGPSGGGDSNGKIAIAVSVLVAASIILIGYTIYHRKQRLIREHESQRNAQAIQKSQRDENDWDGIGQKPVDYEAGNLTGTNAPNSVLQSAARDGGAVISPSDSLGSNQSLLSAGNSINGDSGDEVDATHNLADEFDQYKDQNLEKMRAGVEGNLTGFDGMMSQALTRALIDEDDTTIDPTELLWGGSVHLIGIEIEASALGEVTDWLKRKETPSDEERRLFMQEMLNKMVASVRHGVLGPEEASRSIHECAALLGLQLATEIPVTTLIITGMRKTVTAGDMIDAFSEFGEISEAAVASNQRGFGILRFQANKSVDLAMKRFRTEEIVVQDVAVQVKVLRPGRTNLSADEDEEPLVSGGSDVLS